MQKQTQWRKHYVSACQHMYYQHATKGGVVLFTNAAKYWYSKRNCRNGLLGVSATNGMGGHPAF